MSQIKQKQVYKTTGEVKNIWGFVTFFPFSAECILGVLDLLETYCAVALHTMHDVQ